MSKVNIKSHALAMRKIEKDLEKVVKFATEIPGTNEEGSMVNMDMVAEVLAMLGVFTSQSAA